MSQLTRLELVNFRSYAHAHLDFDGRPLVITGRNGAGKTNILEALSLFSAGRGLRRARSEDWARNDEDLGWKLVLKGAADAPFEIINQARKDAPRQVMIDDKPAQQSAMSQYVRPIWMVPSQDRIWMDSASERRRFFDRIVLSFLPGHGDVVMRYERAMRERNRLLKDRVQDAHWYFAVEEQMDEAAGEIITNRAEALTILNGEWAQNHGRFPQGALELSYEQDFDQLDDRRAFWEAHRNEERFAGTTRFGAHRLEFNALFTAKNQPAALCSTGEQKALLTSLILANARALAARGEFVLLLLDEVAAHLDEARRADLFDEIARFDAQVVMTGTEVELFEALGARGRFVCIVEDDGVSQIEEI